VSQVLVAHAYHPKLQPEIGRTEVQAEIGRTEVQASLGKKFVRPHLNGIKLGMVVCACHPSENEKHKIGRSWSRPIWTKNETLSPKNNPNKKDWSHGSSGKATKCKGLNSNPITTKIFF
jgi:hypothetical protein